MGSRAAAPCAAMTTPQTGRIPTATPVADQLQDGAALLGVQACQIVRLLPGAHGARGDARAAACRFWRGRRAVGVVEGNIVERIAH